MSEAMPEPEYTDADVIDAGHRLGWNDHDIALLLSTMQETKANA